MKQNIHEERRTKIHAKESSVFSTYVFLFCLKIYFWILDLNTVNSKSTLVPLSITYEFMALSFIISCYWFTYWSINFLNLSTVKHLTLGFYTWLSPFVNTLGVSTLMKTCTKYYGPSINFLQVVLWGYMGS